MRAGPEYRYYPEQFFEPYLSHRRKVGWDMYGLLGIERGEGERMHAQHGRNFVFFDAPVGIVFTIDRRLEIGSWLDYGMFLQNVMIAARAFGLETCPQAAFASHHAVVRGSSGSMTQEMVVCGMALGREDTSAPINALTAHRCAQSWSHYFHMVDTLETAFAYGMRLTPRTGLTGVLSVDAGIDPYETTDFDTLLAQWLPLTLALNSLSRSMGHAHAYPFTLPSPVIDKLRFVHQVIHGQVVRPAAAVA
jgi:hypothetical protein